MGTTEDKLKHLLKTKTDIMYALRAKGVEIDENTPFSEYDVKVKNIQGGGDVILCKDMVELMDALPAAVGTLAIVYDPDIDIFLGIFEVKEDETWGYVPTQLNARAEHIAPGYRAYGAEGLVDGTFTTDATATEYDMLADKTAYVNGEKVTGRIIPTYESTLPVALNRQVAYSTTIHDINLDYNVAVYNTASTIRVYQVNDDSINTSYKASVSTSNYSSTGISFYASQVKLAQKSQVINGVEYLRCYCVCKRNSDSKVGVASFLINLETFATSNYVCGISSHTTSQTPLSAVVPTTPNVCVFTRNASGYGSGLNASLYRATFTTTGVTVTAMTTRGTDSSAAVRGFSGWSLQVSNDGKLVLMVCKIDRYGGHYGLITALFRFSDDYGSQTALIDQVSTTDATFAKIINGEFIVRGSQLYRASAPDVPIGSAGFTAVAYEFGMAVGLYYFRIESTSDTEIQVYRISESGLTLIDTIACVSGTYILYPTRYFLYLANNMLQGYAESTEKGALMAMNRLGTDYFNTTSASSTTSDDILKGKAAYLKSGKIVGTMPNNGTKYYTPGDSQITIPKGYHSGSGYIRAVDITSLTDYKACDLLADEILSGALPYYELEYIQSSGTQYINTGVTPSNHYVELKSKYTTATDNSVLFGVGSTDFHMTWYASKWYYGNTSSEKNGGASYLCTNENTIIYGKDNKLMINGNTVDSSVNPSATSTLHILNRPNNPTTKASARIYYFKIYNKSTGALVRDFIPVKRKIDNVVCLYDKVSKTYYTNAGTGSFTAGPVIEEG